MRSNALLPELYVMDFAKSLWFYATLLGWTIEYQRDRPPFAFLSYQGSQLMIQELDPAEDAAFLTGPFALPLGRGINFQIATTDAQAIAETLRRHHYPIRRDVRDSWYQQGTVLVGCRQLLAQDPDGYLLRFSQPIGERPAS